MKFDALPIAHFEDYVPIFLKHMLKLSIPLKILVPAPSEVSQSRIVSPKIAVIRPFLGRKWSLGDPRLSVGSQVVTSYNEYNLLFNFMNHKI